MLKRLIHGRRPVVPQSDTASTANSSANDGRTPNSLSTTSQELENEGAFGLKLVADGNDPAIDIVAVHGLDGHREKTWTADNGVMWLRQFLPTEIPHARILTYGYDSRTHSSEQLTRQTLYGHSMSLVSALSLYRRKTKTDRRPIIFIAHSLGGIMLKSALIHSNMARVSHNEHLKAVKLSTYGILFFGTPHQGGNYVSWGKLLVNVASIFRHTSSDLLEHLEKDSEWLETQLEQYKPISTDFFTIFCFETYPTTLVSGITLMIVPKSSAVVPGVVDAEAIEIRKSHTTMVKFSKQTDDDFQTVAGHIYLMSEKAQDKIASNWAEWDEARAIGTDVWEQDFKIPLELDYSRNPFFTGRKEGLEYINTFLRAQRKERAGTPIVVYGTGGIGKTQLVREFIYAHALDFTSVVWIVASSRQSAENSFLGFMQRLVSFYAQKSTIWPPPYKKIARHLNLAGYVDSSGQINLDENGLGPIVKATTEWLSREGNTEWLLVFDNVDDLETFRITDYFPSLKCGSIIVTSRRPEASRLGEGWSLPVMSERESVSLLQKAYGKEIDVSGTDYEDAKQIVNMLGNLPLAIDQAGAYLNKLSKPLASFPPLFEANFKSTLSKKPPAALWQYGERTVVTTWEISFEAIQSEDPEAAQILLLCSFLSNDDIDPGFLSRGMPKKFASASEIDDHISTLFSFSLASRKQDSDSFSIHPLVHTWARERLSINEAEKLSTIAVRMIACAAKSTESHNVKTDREIIQHINRCSKLTLAYISSIGGRSENEFTEEWEVFGSIFHRQGQTSEAEKMLKRALAGYEKALEPDHPDTLRIVQNLGTLYHSRGKLDEAKKMLSRALIGYEKALEPDHPDTLGVIQNLGMLYYSRGKLDEAEKMLNRALAGYEKALEPDHPDTLRVVQNLGMLYHGRGKLDEAEKMLNRALVGYEKALEPDHIRTLIVVQNLGLLYRSRGKLDEAEKIWKRALIGYEKALEPDHPDTLRVVQNLGILYHSRGKLDKAEKMLSRALTGYETIMDSEDKKLLDTLYILGVLYEDESRFTEAVTAFSRVSMGYGKLLGPQDPETLDALERLRSLQETVKDYVTEEKDS